MFVDIEKENIQKNDSNVTDTARRLMEELNGELFSLLENPTDKEVKKFRDLRDALLVGWLVSMIDFSKGQLYASAQMGINQADRQLQKLNRLTPIKKDITKDVYVGKVEATAEALKQDLITITESIKSNSERVIKELKSGATANTLKEQKKLGAELVADLKKNGISFFTDKIGRKIPLDTYISMRIMTDTVNMERTSFFVRAIEYGVDLVRIIHLNYHPTCELCAPFENKILSIQGDEEGYMPIEQAKEYGLFHPRCDHVPEDMELEPKDGGDDGVIFLSEANQKRAAYNRKRNML